MELSYKDGCGVPVLVRNDLLINRVSKSYSVILFGAIHIAESYVAEKV